VDGLQFAGNRFDRSGLDFAKKAILIIAIDLDPKTYAKIASGIAVSIIVEQDLFESMLNFERTA